LHFTLHFGNAVRVTVSEEVEKKGQSTRRKQKKKNRMLKILDKKDG